MEARRIMMNDYTPKLVYRPEDKIAPIPDFEQGLQTIYAEPCASIQKVDSIIRICWVMSAAASAACIMFRLI